MNITAPVTDYIPASTLTTLNDLVIRGAADPERYGQLSAVYARRSAFQTIPDNTWTLLEWDAELFDVNNEMDLVNHEFVPNRDKYIFVSAGVKFAPAGGNILFGIRIYKNATLRAECHNRSIAGNPHNVFVSCNMVLTTIQALTVEIMQNTGGNLNTDAAVGTNWLSIIEIPVVP